MDVKLQHQNFISSSSSYPWVSRKPIKIRLFYTRVGDLDNLRCEWGNWRKRCVMKHASLESSYHGLSFRAVKVRKHNSSSRKSKRMKRLCPFASADDGVTVNGSPKASTSSDVEEMRIKLNQSLQGEARNDGLVQALHDAARFFDLAIKERSSSSKISWFSTAWLGDRNAWVNTLSYQASVYSLLQAAVEISSRGDGRDRDTNVFVQRSLLRQSAPLENIIREKLSAKQPGAYKWFWSDRVPLVVTTFVNYFERDSRFTAATSLCGKGMASGPGSESDISLLMLALTCIATITKLGPAKISCSQFSSMIPDITGRLMDMLVDFIPIRQAYQFIEKISLRREFLVHFGPRAASCRVKNEHLDTEEVVFWVDLVEKQLQRVIDREKIWARLTTCESIEVLKRDLAIFGFFIAFGRSTKTFLSANGFDVMGGAMEGLIRYLIGGSVLYYPQLSSISSYQLYVEVVCEELDWLKFYPGDFDASKPSHGHNSKREGPPNEKAIPQVLGVCSYWIQSFIKYSKWLDDPANIKAARFLSRGHKRLRDCIEELGIPKNDMMETNVKSFIERSGSGAYPSSDKELDSFDKDLESVEEALIRLEELLQELHVSSSTSGKEHLKAACSDLEKIRKLKKEAEFLEASFRAKAAFLQQGDDEQQRYSKAENRNGSKSNSENSNRVLNNPRGFWSFFVPRPFRRLGSQSPSVDESENEPLESSSIGNTDGADSESNEIHRFELLRNELRELEKRVQRSADLSENDEDVKVMEYSAGVSGKSGGAQLVKVQKKESMIEKSIDKLKEATTDVWQGTQLLAIDVAAATVLLRRALIGDELTEKEKKALRRTLTDLASVIPIGILMLLPVTAVGHAAMLAAIQRYVPALIPSTYGPERLDLLRQLEKVKEMESSEVNLEEKNAEELA